jgi:hypothetical protein
MYLKILTGRPERSQPWPIALLHLDAAGQVVDIGRRILLISEAGGDHK